MKLYYPCNPIGYNQRFGEQQMAVYKEMGLAGHNGIDFLAKDGTPIYAAHDGVVTFAGHDGSGGLGVVIRGNDLMRYKGEDTNYKTIYWHLKEGSVVVLPDQQVKTGDLLGLADNTGLSTGSHLHFGLKPIYQGEQKWQWYNADQNNGYFGAIDPEPYFVNELAFDKRINTIREKIIELLKQWVALLQKK